jgi:hypothetical protein
MLGQISIRQFDEWRAYADLEPFDEMRADLRAASIVQAVRNGYRGRRRPQSLKDCLLLFGEQAAAPTPERAVAEVRATMGLLMAQQKADKAAKAARRQRAR